MSPRGRSVCQTPFHLTRLVFSAGGQISSGRNRCLSAGLGASRTYANPPWCLIGRVLKQVKTRGHSGGSNLKRLTVVSSSSGHPVGFSLVDSFVQWPFSDDLRVSGHEFSALSSYLRERFAGQNLSNTARDLLLASWQTKSNKTYDSHFKTWLCWCSSRSSDPVSVAMSEVAIFWQSFTGKGINPVPLMCSDMLFQCIRSGWCGGQETPHNLTFAEGYFS